MNLKRSFASVGSILSRALYQLKWIEQPRLSRIGRTVEPLCSIENRAGTQ